MNIPKNQIVLQDSYELIEIIASAIRHYEANKITSERLDDAHKYVRMYCFPQGWGKNVWHTILDDAIRMKKLYEPGESNGM